METIVTLITVIVCSLLFSVLYVLPAFIAAYRNTRNGPTIFLLNFLLGWTIVGWVAVLVWASTDKEY